MKKPMNFEMSCPVDVLFDLFESKEISTGMTKDVPGGAVIQLGEMPMQKRHITQDAAPLVVIAVSFGTSVASKLLADWLSGKMKKSKIQRLRINRKEVEITPDGILKAIEETIEIEHEK